MERLGWECVDVILFSGDAYVDHPSFGNALIGRFLESLGLKVAIVPQPNWRDDLRDFKKFGKPNLFFAVSAGNMDSMVNHYTAQKRLRSEDAYTAGGKAGQRPDYATVVYGKIIKDIFPDSLLIIGGIEASLRRLTHYDYWSDSLKPSILTESRADYLVYGMAEQPLRAIVDTLKTDKNASLRHIRQLAYLSKNDEKLDISNIVELPSHESCLKDKKVFSEAFIKTEKEYNKMYPATIVQLISNKKVIINPPYPPLDGAALDAVYGLPFLRKPHLKYDKSGVPAFEMIKDSINIHRGCFGGCAFCALSAHQGKFIGSRTEDSILKELETIASFPEFKGHISDLGGPSANMYKMKGENLEMCEKCARPSCIFPNICTNLNNSHKALVNLYEKASQVEGIKKITIGSGIRYDLFIGSLNDKEKYAKEYLKLLILKHVSGRLKVAPEHTSEKVLKAMRKTSFNNFLLFKAQFDLLNKQHHLNYQIIPYFISGHPDTTYDDMAELALCAKKHDLIIEQAQDFTPTPMTLSSVIYYTGFDPYTKKGIYVAKSNEEKTKQKSFFYFTKKENIPMIRQILTSRKRLDLFEKIYPKRFK